MSESYQPSAVIVQPDVALTVAQSLHDAMRTLEARGIDQTRLEAEVLLAVALGIDRTHLLARLGDDVPPEALARFEATVARRLEHEPLAYILGRREFYGIDIECAPGVLIPRPETELLVELALGEIASRRGDLVRVADVGAGSGAIAVAITLNADAARVTAIDASAKALVVARRNVVRHGLSQRVTLVEGDLLAGGGTFDVIVANLPYVADDEWPSLAPEIREHEPREALVAGVTGTEVIERLLEMLPDRLSVGGMLAAEIGCTQGARLLDRARRRVPGENCSVRKDLAGRERVLVVKKKLGG